MGVLIEHSPGSFRASFEDSFEMLLWDSLGVNVSDEFVSLLLSVLSRRSSEVLLRPLR